MHESRKKSISLPTNIICTNMMEFIQTLGKGIVQGFSQFITNDLSSYVPLFIIAAVLLIGMLIKKWMQK